MTESDTPTRPSGPPPAGKSSLAVVGLTAAAAIPFLALRGGAGLPAEALIGLGVFIFLIAPGLLLHELLFPDRRLPLIERLPVAIALSVGVWAGPGLLAYLLEMRLATSTAVELAVIGGLALASLGRAVTLPSVPATDPRAAPPAERLIAAAVLLALAGLALWTGAFRAPVIDWDYYNYISHVNKLVHWDRASLAHFAYKDAPPDPIHSYNIWALQWALIARWFDLGPIPLYLRSGFIMIPAGAAAFYALFRRLLPPRPALIGLFLFVCYHVFYGGLIFLGSDTFFPDDSQRMIVFPALLALFLLYLERPAPGLLVGLALSALGMSVVHVFWGMCFYLCLAGLAGWLWFDRIGAFSALSTTLLRDKWKWAGWALVAALAFPFTLGLAKMAVMWSDGDSRGAAPLINYTFASPGIEAWSWLFKWVAAPLAALAVLAWSKRPTVAPHNSDELTRLTARVIAAIIAAAVIALPYIWLRHQATQVTVWEQFGRNPYRAFITENVFILNPFKWSVGNPEMTFFPLFIPGYLLLPLLWRQAKKEWPARLAVVALLLVPAVCFHPALASLFAKYLSLGYLRRMLRLAAPFSLLPTALALDWLIGFIGGKLPALRRPAAASAAGLIAAFIISLACIPFAGSPEYYDRMFDKMVRVARAVPAGELPDDRRPFEAIARGGWFALDAVIFSDIWTSFRLTAYLPQYVAVQAKPGAGIADQDERRRLELEFFDTRTSIVRMREILDRFGAEGVIVNRSPSYQLLGLPMGHLEAAGKLKADPSHFTLLHNDDHWMVFKRR
mgnify:CR=1 FL=1